MKTYLTKKEINELVTSNSKKYILDNYTKNDLIQMHYTIYNCKPLSYYKKETILIQLINYFARIRTVKNIHKIYNLK